MSAKQRRAKKQQVGRPGFRKSIRQRATKGGRENLYPFDVALLAEDEKRLDDISERFVCESRSRAMRLAVHSWYLHLSRRAAAKGFRPPDMQELRTGSSIRTGRKIKIYATKQQMAELAALQQLTGCDVLTRIIRAAVRWQHGRLGG